MLGAALFGPAPVGPRQASAQAVAGSFLWLATGNGTNPAQLFQVNPTNGASTLVGNVVVGALPVGLTGLAVHPTTRVLYGATSARSPNLPGHLVTIDKTTAVATDVGAFNVPDPLCAGGGGGTATLNDVTFRNDGVLFGFCTQTLYTVNLATGAVTAVGNTGEFTAGNALSFLPLLSAGTLYHIGRADSPASNLHTLNPATGARTSTTALTPAQTLSFNALTTNPAGTILLAVRLDNSPGVGTSSLVSVDQATGAVTVLGALPANSDALALELVAPPTPTPTNTATSTATATPTSTSTSTATPTATASATATATPTSTPSPTPTASATATATPSPTFTPTATTTPTSTLTATPTGTTAVPASATPTASPTATPTATVTPPAGPPCGGIGTQCHADLTLTGNTGSGLILYAVGPIEPGPCAQPISNCVQTTTTGSFLLTGVILGLAPGTSPVVQVPVVDGAGVFLGVREVICAPAAADGRSVCTALINEPNVFPQLATVPGTGIVEVRIVRVAAPGAVRSGGGQPAVALVPLLPPVLLPPPVLIPLRPVVLPGSPETGLGAPPELSRPEVPVIPEGNSFALLASGLTAVAGWAALRRRARSR
jgi:hypothetical protein